MHTPHVIGGHPRKKRTVDLSVGMHTPFSCCYWSRQVHAYTLANGTVAQIRWIEIQVHACICRTVECGGQVVGTNVPSLFCIRSFAFCILNLHTFKEMSNLSTCCACRFVPVSGARCRFNFVSGLVLALVVGQLV